MTKTCSKCGLEKPLDDFYRRGEGHRPDCILCVRAYHRRYQEKNKEALRAKYAVYNRKYMYGLDQAAFDNLVAIQGGRCAICEQERTPLVVDHDHRCCPGTRSCGQCVRGLLCKRCNWALGNFGDDVETVRRALMFLQFYEEIREINDIHMAVVLGNGRP